MLQYKIAENYGSDKTADSITMNLCSRKHHPLSISIPQNIVDKSNRNMQLKDIIQWLNLGKN